MASACENAYETCLTSPNQDLVIFVGVGKLRMTSVIFFIGFTPSTDIRKPANSTSSSAN